MPTDRVILRRLSALGGRIRARGRVSKVGQGGGAARRGATPDHGGDQAGGGSAAPDPRVVAHLERLDWTDGPALVLSGWAYLTGVPTSPEDSIVVELVDPSTGAVTQLPVARVTDPEINARSGDKVDHAGAGFTIRLPAEGGVLPVAQEVGGSRRLRVMVEVATAEGTFRTTLLSRAPDGSAAVLRTRSVNGRHVRPRWSAGTGLQLVGLTHPATAHSVVVGSDGALVLVRARGGFHPTEVVLTGDGRAPATALEEAPDPGTFLVRISPPGSVGSAGPRTWSMALRDRTGRSEPVHWAGEADAPDLLLGAGHRLHCSPDLRIHVSCSPDTVLIDEIAALTGPEPRLEITGRLVDPTLRVDLQVADARRQVPSGPLEPDGNGAFTARVPLLEKGWDDVARPLPSGVYRLSAACPEHDVRLLLTPTCAATLGRMHYGATANLQVLTSGGEPAVEVSPPLASEEIGPYHQSVLRTEHAHRSGPLEGTFLESWFGRNVSDNPLALFTAMRRQGVGAPYTWGVKDLSVAVPDGARSVVVGSRAHWAALTGAQWVIINHWQRQRAFTRRPGQVVVQTWHGTPLKLLGLDRPSKAGQTRAIRIVRRGTAAWDHLITQNAHTTEVFRRAYLWDRPILEVGYPRNDVLTTATDEDRTRIRAELGMDTAETVILYAPTWRDDNRAQVGVLDVPSFARRLGPGYRILVRGHTITAKRGARVDAPTVTDVTTYPDVATLMVAADILITDYSSIMFDFSVTGRPILFYVPDLAEYTGGSARTNAARARGAYFDLAEQAPGPLLTSQSNLVGAIRDVDAIRARFDARYRAWQARYNPYDDGHASERVLAVLFPEQARQPPVAGGVPAADQHSRGPHGK